MCHSVLVKIVEEPLDVEKENGCDAVGFEAGFDGTVCTRTEAASTALW